jgi:anaerobic ribonucleoside-triphosphate reductase activating protein
MNYSEIKYYDIANGVGVRTTLFVSGCRRHCKNCFNAMTWDFAAGQPFTEEVQNKILDSLAPAYVSGLTLLGGEPFEPENQRGLIDFVREVRRRYPDKTIWAFSGNTLEEIQSGHAHCEVTDELLSYIDVLVDGAFVEELHDITLRFRGSANQRLLDLPKTLAQGKAVWWDEKEKEKAKGLPE